MYNVILRCVCGTARSIT